MTLGQKTLHLDGLSWHCLSIFYARRNSGALLEAIGDFCEENGVLFTHWSLWFSAEQGERVNFIFISKTNDTETLTDSIEKYFGRFLKENPSERLLLVPYGETLYVPYPNNSSLWNAFEIPSFLREGQTARDFARATSRMIVGLWDEEAPYDENVASIAAFMSIKLQKAAGDPFPKIDDPETAETLRSYWDYDEDEVLAEWLGLAMDVPAALPVIHRQLNCRPRVI